MATMKDVATKAGVSVATVSAVVNDSTFVSDELRLRVENAIRALKYRPNAVARSLKKRQTKLLGMIVKDIKNPFYPEMVSGTEEAARSLGYNLFLSTTSDDPATELEYLDTMLEYQVDGMVLSTVDTVDQAVLRRVIEEKLPFVLLNRLPEDYTGTYAGVDFDLAGQLAVDHLVSLGKREIGFVGAEMVTAYARERGFRAGLARHRLEIPHGWYHYCSYSQETAYRTYSHALKGRQPPEAIFAANDLMAFGVIEALREAGYAVPGDVAVVGCDNILFSGSFRIPLTTIDLQKFTMGRLAAEMLVETIEGRLEPGKQVKLKPQLIIRESCGASTQNQTKPRFL